MIIMILLRLSIRGARAIAKMWLRTASCRGVSLDRIFVCIPRVCMVEGITYKFVKMRSRSCMPGRTKSDESIRAVNHLSECDIRQDSTMHRYQDAKTNAKQNKNEARPSFERMCCVIKSTATLLLSRHGTTISSQKIPKKTKTKEVWREVLKVRKFTTQFTKCSQSLAQRRATEASGIVWLSGDCMAT